MPSFSPLVQPRCSSVAPPPIPQYNQKAKAKRFEKPLWVYRDYKEKDYKHYFKQKEKIRISRKTIQCQINKVAFIEWLFANFIKVNINDIEYEHK